MRWKLLALLAIAGVIAWWLLRPDEGDGGGGILPADGGDPPRRRGFGVIPGLLEEFAVGAAEEPATLPAGAVETGGDRTFELTHEDAMASSEPAPSLSPSSPTPALLALSYSSAPKHSEPIPIGTQYTGVYGTPHYTSTRRR